MSAEFGEQQNPKGWESLLAATVRLVDVHDSGHEPGCTPVVAMDEERPGRQDGLWLSIAIDLLKYLAEVEFRTNESWVVLDEYIAYAMEHYGIGEEDVRWAVRYLATPTRLSLRRISSEGKQERYSTKRTALLERPGMKGADYARLTREGRAAVKLASAASGILYAQYDVQKMVAALRYGDFAEASRLMDAIAQELRDFSQDLNRLLERPVCEETRKFWEDSKEAYFNAIRAFNKHNDEARVLLDSEECTIRFEKWKKHKKEETVSLGFMREQLRRIASAVVRLNGTLQGTITTLLTQTQQSAGLVDFRAMALRLAYSPLSDERMEMLSSTLWPVFVEGAAVCASDLKGLIPTSTKPVSEKVVSLTIHDSGEGQTLSALREFLEEHRSSIVSRLDNGESIPLREMLDAHLMGDGAFMERLAAIAGIYLYPEWLEEEGRERQIEVEVRAGDSPFKLPDGTVLHGDNPVLRLARKEADDGCE